MAGQSRDDSASPLSNTPKQSSHPIFVTSEQHPRTDTLLPPLGIADTLQNDTSHPAAEATDYWNMGLTHNFRPPMSSVESGTHVQHFPLSSLPQGDLHDSAGSIPFAGDQDAHEVSSLSNQRNVQFLKSDAVQPQNTHSRHGSWDGPDTPGKSRGASFMSKLKALTNTPGLQSPKSPNTPPPAISSDLGSQSMTNSPITTRFGNRVPDTLTEEQSDADADVEETGDEAVAPDDAAPRKKKRRMRRFKKGHMATPSVPIRFTPGETDGLGTYNRLLRRRASMPDTSAREQVLSDGEPRAPAVRRPFRRGHSFMNPITQPGGEDVDGLESSAVVGRRHGHMRRITVFGGGGVSDGDAITPRRPFFNSDRASNFGAQKWKQVKNTLKLIRQRKEDNFDYFRSAELMAELRAGAPAVLMLASMIQRDEHGNKRIPVLLEQLHITIKDSSPMPDDDKDRHWLFIIELEYGSGPSRMVWTVTRTIRDIYNLHFRYRFALNNDKYKLGRADLGSRPKQPKFPYSAFPYLRRARGKGDESDDDDQASGQGEDTAGEGTADEGAGDGMMSGPEGSRQPSRKRSRVNLLGMRRRSTGITDPGEMSNTEGAHNHLTTSQRRQRYVEKQRRILEKYLSEMVRWLMFRADSNRLCRFLELSALGVRLAAEGSYHGKEGYLYIQSSKGLDFRRVLTPSKVIARHSRKWFLVRQSYIVCVESPENMNIYDVYLVDSKFGLISKRNALKQISSKGKGKGKSSELDMAVEAPSEKHHTLTLHTSERKVRLFSRYQSVMKQFEGSINEMLRQNPWYEKKRFDSFAPVRHGVFAQWLVDGRDYMWNVSRAINMARDVIYIHDWWLSPELYMRRPACISQKWRLDRLLQKKAREGVKIFIIIYRNVEAAVPIDSEYTKFSLLNLHPNVFVQRSPNQFKKNQFFFAHHEKICIVDHDVAFVGGIDLCFGRWDCPQHPIVDDKPTGFEESDQPRDAEHCQLFPGKDYSNPRVQDFFRLSSPYEEMYDRSKVPRMPWHDISMQVVGQPARDLTRHFVQRWNYLRRGRKPTRPLPFLLPPPDAKVDELEALGLSGTCEVQILRSASAWSLGIEDTEHSIQTAYIKMIEESDHYVYMENQFFITSTEVYNTKIANRIGDALVERIIRAHEKHENWRCTIVIPLMPGFQNTVDEQEGTSVRLILMCQFRSICRGEHSIFGRLRAAGIEPEEYISFFSLRQWGVMSSDALVTEQLYIHAKTIIVDDRIALIGSANINERSMLGSRDSECAAIVRDTDMLWTTMAGKPYQVGRFAHTLRLRLMREHLGLDVDAILEEEREEEMDPETFEQTMDEIFSEDAEPRGEGAGNSTDSRQTPADERKPEDDEPAWGDVTHAVRDQGRDSVIVDGHEVLVHDAATLGEGTMDTPKKASQAVRSPNRKHSDPIHDRSEDLPPIPPLDRRTTDQLGLPRAAQLPTLPIVDDSDIGGPPVHIDPESGRPTVGPFHPMAADIRLSHIHKDCMRDPIDSNFIDELWGRVAANNTKLYRRVFRCMPDSEVSTWAEYREYTDYGERFRKSMEGKSVSDESELKREPSHAQRPTAAGAGISAPAPAAIARVAAYETGKITEKSADLIGLSSDGREKSSVDMVGDRESQELSEKHPLEGNDDRGVHSQRQTTADTGKATDNRRQTEEPLQANQIGGDLPLPVLETSPNKLLDPQMHNRERRTTFSTLEKPTSKDLSSPPSRQNDTVKRRRRANTKGSRRGFTIEDMPSRADAGELLKMVQGNLVQFPYDWLLTEEQNGNWGYQVDGVAPLSIYN